MPWAIQVQCSKYTYCYCTKSSHFSFVLEEALRNNVHIETSSAFDINIVLPSLNVENRKETYVVCNGFKMPGYTKVFQSVE